MTKRRMVSWLVTGICVMILVVAGCSKPPTEAIQAAEQVISDAKTEGAEQYAATRLKAAEEALADAKARVDQKAYSEARQQAEMVIGMADSFKMDIAAAKEMMKLDAERKVEEFKTMWADMNASIEKTRGAAGKALAKEASDLAALVNTLPQQMNEGKYAEVLKAIDEATVKANELKERAAGATGKK
ncbi:MAG: DUF4398 domain-containing protein [Candidatus Latescibacteria bacterium]|nr:DUF4398 domain-containing protein [Candidatus Latescibacterota bacterium]